jgi:hypothetical protein
MRGEAKLFGPKDSFFAFKKSRGPLLRRVGWLAKVAEGSRFLGEIVP